MAKTKAHSLALPAIIDLDALDSVRDQLIEAVESGPVTVDASGVERVATNGLIMLLSAAESARRNDFAFELANPSEPVSAAIERLGLTETFDSMLKG